MAQWLIFFDSTCHVISEFFWSKKLLQWVLDLAAVGETETLQPLQVIHHQDKCS